MLTLVTSLWWIAGLWAQSGYGLNILKFTETLQVVSLSSLPSEVLRGLGYWFFYGIDRIGHWTEASVPYTQNLGLLVRQLRDPGARARSRRCACGGATAPTSWCSPSSASSSRSARTRTTTRRSLGGLFKSFAESSSFGLALRSTSRAVPLVALGLAVLLGVGRQRAVGVAWQGRGRQVARRVAAHGGARRAS